MYDFVAVLTFDEYTENKLIDMKQRITKENVKVKSLPPHITIDLYKNIDTNTIIETIDNFIEEIHCFPFDFICFNHFDKKILFLQPNNVVQFEKIYNLFESNLGKYKIEDNANNGNYKPHTTIAYIENQTELNKIVTSPFLAFQGEVTDLCIFNNKKQLMKKYNLKPSTYNNSK